MGTTGAERFWIVGRNTDWCLINLYGQRYDHYIKTACVEMANKLKHNQTYEERLVDLLICVDECNYRLYRSDDTKAFHLVERE
jgi:hypothetical protein